MMHFASTEVFEPTLVERSGNPEGNVNVAGLRRAGLRAIAEHYGKISTIERTSLQTELMRQCASRGKKLHENGNAYRFKRKHVEQAAIDWLAIQLGPDRGDPGSAAVIHWLTPFYLALISKRGKRSRLNPLQVLHESAYERARPPMQRHSADKELLDPRFLRIAKRLGMGGKKSPGDTDERDGSSAVKRARLAAEKKFS